MEAKPPPQGGAVTTPEAEVGMSDTKMLKKHFDEPGGLSLFPWTSRQWFDDFMREGFWRPMFAIEEFREGEEFIVRAELPGVDPDKDLELEVIDGMLVISAEKSESHEHDSDHVHRSEFRYGSLTRSVPVPKGVREKDIKASYRDGVLEVRMAVPSTLAGDMSHRIEVKRA